MELEYYSELLPGIDMTEAERAEYFRREAEDARFAALEKRIEELEKLMKDDEIA